MKSRHSTLISVLLITLVSFHIPLPWGGVGAGLLHSCATDAYDKGEGEYSLMQGEMAEVHVGSDVRVDYFITDDDTKFTVSPTYASSWMKTPDSTYRAVTYFIKKSDGDAEVKGLTRVGVIKPKKQKGLKTDPVRFESAWMSKGGEYLNISIYLLLGTTADEKAIHTLGCHLDTLKSNPDKTKTMQLTLLHDQGGVPEYYSQRYYLSVPLKGATTDSVSIAINTYDGIVRKSFNLHENRKH